MFVLLMMSGKSLAGLCLPAASWAGAAGAAGEMSLGAV